MLAHSQGSMLNASRLASGLMVSAPTVTNYISLLVDLLLVRRLLPYFGKTRKRLFKSPKVYVRDSGIVHALLGISDSVALAGHPVVGASWEGFVMESLLSVKDYLIKASFYRTSAGAEIDLILEHGRGLWAIEIKRGLAPKLSKGFHIACEDLQAERGFVVYSGEERYPIAQNIEVIGVREMAEEIVNLSN